MNKCFATSQYVCLAAQPKQKMLSFFFLGWGVGGGNPPTEIYGSCPMFYKASFARYSCERHWVENIQFLFSPFKHTHKLHRWGGANVHPTVE